MTEKTWLTTTEASERLQFIGRSTLNRYLREWWSTPDERFPEGEVIRLSGKRGQFRLTEKALSHFEQWSSDNTREEVYTD